MYQQKTLEVKKGEEVEQKWAEEWAARNFGIAHKCPQFDDFDYYIEKNGRIDHFLEIKRRYFKSVEYTQTIIPLRKYIAAQALLKAGYPVYFLVIWNDIVGYLELWKTPVKIDVIERADRGVKGLYAFYNLSDFKKVEQN